MNDEGRLQSAPATNNISAGDFSTGGGRLTPLQEALTALNAAFVVATERLDERSQAAFLDIATIKLAREQARRLHRERRRAA